MHRIVNSTYSRETFHLAQHAEKVLHLTVNRVAGLPQLTDAQV